MEIQSFKAKSDRDPHTHCHLRLDLLKPNPIRSYGDVPTQGKKCWKPTHIRQDPMETQPLKVRTDGNRPT